MADEAVAGDIDAGEAEVQELPELAELFEQAAQLGTADHQTAALPDGELPQLPQLFEQADRIGAIKPPQLPLQLDAPPLDALLPSQARSPVTTAQNLNSQHEQAQDNGGALDESAPMTTSELTHFHSLCNMDLIARAKLTGFPPAIKWAKNRKLRSGENQHTIAFLNEAAL